MKKIISIVLGVAALAACTKTSVSYEQPGEIRSCSCNKSQYD